MLATAPPALRVKRRRPRHLTDLANSFVPESIERLIARYRRRAWLLAFEFLGRNQLFGAESRIAEIDLRSFGRDSHFDTYHQRLVGRVDLELIWTNFDDVARCEGFVLF